MAKILVTGSADGLGKLAATQLIAMGHQVVLHTRNAQRADETAKKVKGAYSLRNCQLLSLKILKTLHSMSKKSSCICNMQPFKINQKNTLQTPEGY
ncbi:hypothetical protein SRABI27_00499 [Pedobacter sp. Bi27]|uniref:SDR family NAD(P)-dependent oxidoreductase n=1 Tax=Pedobacter sp. Bi27 TaxID=2822351 RepID=UPI001D52E5ED|nr:SDR family NAD(P)-dependent oxidoreductase [Pedobacter sp. Bi27]CAH0150030.1 hypothetical protein SRABI27_00499 [Pedobacter sp. Bi27]